MNTKSREIIEAELQQAAYTVRVTKVEGDTAYVIVVQAGEADHNYGKMSAAKLGQGSGRPAMEGDVYKLWTDQSGHHAALVNEPVR